MRRALLLRDDRVLLQIVRSSFKELFKIAHLNENVFKPFTAIDLMILKF